MFLRKGKFIITSLGLAASAAIGTVSAVKVAPTSTEDHLLSTYDPYDNGDITTLLVSYRDDAGHENVVNHTIKMKGQGKSVNEKKNFKLKAKHKVEKKKKGKSSGSKDKKGKSEKDRRLNLFEVEEDDNAFISGFSIIEVKSDDIDAEIAALSALPGVTYVEEDSMMHILSTEYQQNLRGEGGVAEHVREIQDSIKATADEIIGDGDSNHGRRLAEETPYGIEMVNAEYVWNKGPPPTSSPKMKICVVDTGYDLGHEDLPKTSHGVAGWNDDSGQFGRWENDGHGHGTHCAGTIGAIGNNNKGVTSVNPDPDKFDFFIGKGLSDGGSGTNANVLNAVKECVDNGAKVISMSLGGSLNSATANTVYEDAYDSGVLIIAAAGNSASDSWGYPAGYPTVMSVGSVMESGELSGFSTRNDQVEITGPGSAVLSTWKNNGYNTISGTSMACPHVAGVAALLWSHFPECTNNQIRNAMIRSAAEPPASDSRNTAGWDKYFGWGTVDAQAAYILLESGCEIAGGLKDPPSGKLPHDLAMGGKFQKDEGCTIDSHCDQFNPALGQSLCNTDTGSCERVVVPCTGVQKEVVVEILTDNYPGETTWTLIDLCGYGENISGGPYTRRSRTYSSSNDVCEGRYKFQINDSYGDGICCGYGSGSYSIKYDGVEAASGGSFQYNELKTFGTPCQSDPTPPPTTHPPTEPPTAQPTPVPTTAAPTAAPTTSPTAAPTTSPTPVPSAPPTSSPTPVPTTAAPTPVPTTAAPTVSPTSSPTASPSTPPTAAPTSATSSPTKNPTAAPTSSPTSSPVVPSKTLFCGRGDGYVPCAEGRTKTAPVNEEHEVRCCRDCTGINCSRPWKRKCSSLDPNLYARSKVGGVCKVGTFAEAQQFCENASNDDSSRLCTPKEIENNCAKGTGCQFDKQLVWACGNDGYACATDAECCESCVNGTCGSGSGSGSSLFS